MTSQINPDWPVEGRDATTQSVRDNFDAAKREIEDLQSSLEYLENAGYDLGQRVITVPRGQEFYMAVGNFIGYMKIEIVGDCRLTVGSGAYGSPFDVYSLYHVMTVQDRNASPTPGWVFCWEERGGWDRAMDTRLRVYAPFYDNYGQYRSVSPVYIVCWPTPGFGGSSSS